MKDGDVVVERLLALIVLLVLLGGKHRKKLKKKRKILKSNKKLIGKKTFEKNHLFPKLNWQWIVFTFKIQFTFYNLFFSSPRIQSREGHALKQVNSNNFIFGIY